MAEQLKSSAKIRQEAEELRILINDMVSASLPPDESQELAEEVESKIDYNSENARLDYENRVQKKKRRERWDTTLLSTVVVGFIFSYATIVLIGLGWLSFGENAFAVPTVVAAGVLQTFGLAKLAIQYFFNDNDEIRHK